MSFLTHPWPTNGSTDYVAETLAVIDEVDDGLTDHEARIDAIEGGVIPGWKAGRWYSIQQQYACNFGGNTGAMVANTIYATPLWVPFGGRAIDRVGAAVGTGVAASTVRLMAHAPGADGHPGALIWDFGTVSTATSGDKEITVSRVLPGGLCFLTMIPDAAITMLRFEVVYGGIMGNSSQAGNAGAPYRATGAFTAPNPFGTSSISYIGDGFPRLSVRAA